jgi:SAM-dependent methyltransferase
MSRSPSENRQMEREWRGYFDALADERDVARKSGWSWPLADAVAQALSNHLHVDGREGMILDAGCGSGLILGRLAGKCRLVGCDFSERILHDTSQRISSPLVCADIVELPFRQGTFDKVLCVGVLNHIPQSEAALAELARVLRPGGELFLVYLNWSTWRRLIRRVLRSVDRRLTSKGYELRKWFGREQLHAMLRAAQLHPSSDTPIFARRGPATTADGLTLKAARLLKVSWIAEAYLTVARR